MRCMSGEDQVASGLLRGHLRRLGLRPEDLAQHTGLDVRVLADYISGARQPPLGDLIRLIEATGYELHFDVRARDRHDEVLALRSDPVMTQALQRDEQRRLGRFHTEANGEEGAATD